MCRGYLVKVIDKMNGHDARLLHGTSIPNAVPRDAITPACFARAFFEANP